MSAPIVLPPVPTPKRAGRLKQVFLSNAFRPSVFGLFTNPFYIARKGLYKSIKTLAPRVRGRVLDVGCGQKPYETLFTASEYVGLELDTPEKRRTKRADVFYDGKVFPFENESFDTVIMSEVLEHIFNPDEFLDEVNRILKCHGGLLLTAPFIWDEHEQPFDYARYTSFGLRHLLARHGFEVQENYKTVADASLFCQLASCYFRRQVESWTPWCKAIAWVTFSAPLNIMGEVISLLSPKNCDLYFGNVLFAEKVSSSNQD